MTASNRQHRTITGRVESWLGLLPALLLARLGGAAAGCAAGPADEAAGSGAPADAASTDATTSGGSDQAPLPAGKVRSLPLVERAIDFQGRDAIESSTISLRIGSKSGSFRIDAQPGDLFDYWVYTEQDGSDVVYHHTNVAGETIEKLVDGQPVELVGEREQQRARDFVSQRVYFPFLPYRLRDPSVYLEDLGTETWDGEELRKVKVTFQPGTSSGADDSYLYWFDPETAEMRQFAYSFGGGLRLRKMKNARRVGGIWFADADNYAKAGDGLSVDEISPESVADWELLSTVVVDEITVEPR